MAKLRGWLGFIRENNTYRFSAWSTEEEAEESIKDYKTEENLRLEGHVAYVVELGRKPDYEEIEQL